MGMQKKTPTAHIRALITRWVSDDFPGWVECRFTDRFGKEWSIVDKLPVVSTDDLRRGSKYPQPALIACEVVATAMDHAGRDVIHVNTLVPFGIEATDGATSFELYSEQLHMYLVPSVDPEAGQS
ncbi:protein of unknown function [Bradyrhizobium sp. ORS 285]|uniref:hypothetical protein n=1 Tax=Bradyrhizobium sp. ORS 285 TaxID=115808 RepID=UPI000240AB85|nr:hypothetical protein [Bradyrhizobium sp. ORS 285]CCD85905.1 hypothetical protein BRAO285_1580043 [Bradyrhizobium sp. ORS 285]SMX59173.1 protein of unknown function [Bradyrhizobium sp. ORS 285]